MTHIDLFSGIGGFALACAWNGIRTIAHSEIDPFACAVYHKHFPESRCVGNIKDFDWREYEKKVFIITGGFPCQPFSQAGKRRGKADDRYLWPQMLRVIGEVKPKWVLGENVRGITSIEDGLVFEQVLSDLEGIGYEVWPIIVPACSINAPHRRDRVWFIANAKCDEPGEHSRANYGAASTYGGESQRDVSQGRIQPRSIANTDARRIRRHERKGATEESIACRGNEWSAFNWDRFPTAQPCLRRGDDGLSNRVDRLKALGNAIVPQVAYKIIRAMIDTELNSRNDIQ